MLLSALFYSISALSIFSIYRILGGELWFRLFLGFFLLSLSQVSMFFSLIVKDASLSFSLYTASPALALSGFYMILTSRRYTPVLILTPLVLTPSFLDLLASLLAFILSRYFRSYAKIAFSILCISHFARSLTLILLSSQALPAIIPATITVVSEFLRASGALVLAIGYLRRLL